MPNDAKLGLVVGMGIVIALAIVFYRKDGSATLNSLDKVAAATPSIPTGPGRNPVGAPAAFRKHIVQEGETLADISRQYFGDASKAAALRQLNRSTLEAADHPPAGAVIFVPEYLN